MQKLKNYAPLVLLFVMSSASAATGTFSSVENSFIGPLSSFAGPIQKEANGLFWTLAIISMVWTFGMMAMKRAEFGEIFGELIRFAVTTGFLYWLLLNGPTFAIDIWQSLQTLGTLASGAAIANPGSLIDQGLAFFYKVWGLTDWNPITGSPFASLVAVVIAALVLLEFALIAINLLLIHVTAYFVGYVGLFVLGFGGAKWTSEYAIAYYKAMLATGMQLLGMMAVILIGMKLVTTYETSIVYSSAILTSPSSLINLLISVFILHKLAKKIPEALAGLVNGNPGTGASNAGNVTMAGAAAAGAAAGIMAGKMALGAIGGAGGATKALQAAAAAAQGGEASGGASGMLASAAALGGAEAGAAGGGAAPGGGGGAAKAAAAARFAGRMASEIGSAAGRRAGGRVGSLLDAVQGRMNSSIGGRIADEIKNPGAKAQATADAKTVAAFESQQAAQAIAEKAFAINFIGPPAPPPSNSVGPG